MDWKKWVPLFVREGGAAAREKYEAIVEEPSVGLKRAIVDYFASCVFVRGYGGEGLDRDKTIAIEQALNLDLHRESVGGKHPLDPFIRLPLQQMLSVVDYCVHHFIRDAESYRVAESLRDAMARARFAYAVDLDARVLVRVLPPGVEEAVRAGFGVNGANLQLREAVHWATGVNTDPLKSFDALIRALEAVVIPALSPNDGKATLGRVLGGIRSGQIKLACSLPRSAQAPAGAMLIPDVVRGMLELVWSGYERHVTGGVPPTVTDVRALLGVVGSLVDWFGSGIVKKAP
jgi:hypothetical protein